MLSRLINQLSEDLNIKQDSSEDKDQWIFRLIYSASGQSALASLYDITQKNLSSTNAGEGNDSSFISIEHFKKRAKKCLNALIEASNLQSFCGVDYKEQDSFSASINNVVNDIYDTYYNTGYFFHSPYSLYPTPFEKASIEPITLVKGLNSLKVRTMSGLALFNNSKEELLEFKDAYQSNSLNDLTQDGLNCFDKLFELNITLKQFYETYIDSVKDGFTLLNPNHDCEFLNLNYKPHTSYWSKTVTPNATLQNLGLGRFTNYVPHKYFLYYVASGEYYYSMIPAFLLKDFNQPNDNSLNASIFANAILNHNNKLHSIKVVKSDELVYIKLPYALPQAENNLLKLLSWPLESDYVIDKSNKRIKVFNRSMTYSAFYCFETILKSKGYTFSV